jgi:hypothetical protein
MTRPDFEDFAQILKRHLAALATADSACAAAAENRRAVLKAAREDGVIPALLKQIAREQAMNPDLRTELASYRSLVSQPFTGTELGQAAQAAQ